MLLSHYPPTTLSVNQTLQCERPGLTLDSKMGRKPIHSAILLSDPPSWAHLRLMNGPGHRWTHTQIDRDTATTNKGKGAIMRAFAHADTHMHSHCQPVSSLSLFLWEFLRSDLTALLLCQRELSKGGSDFQPKAMLRGNMSQPQTPLTHIHTHALAESRWIYGEGFSAAASLWRPFLREMSGCEQKSLICQKAFQEEKA